MRRGSKLEKRLIGGISRLNRSFELIEPDDHVMVAISGGKDSWALLHLLRAYERRLPFSFTLIAVNLDQGQPGFSSGVLRDYLDAHGYAHHLVCKDTYSVVKANTREGKSYCSLCSRLRRGILYDVAVELGATKIALGHHRDDVIETLLLNLFYSGQLKSMPPRLESDDGRNVIIRPLAWTAEEDLVKFSTEQGFPILPCNLCGSQDKLKREHVRALLRNLETENPLVRANMLAAVGNVKPSHLHDQELFLQAASASANTRDVPASPSLVQIRRTEQ